MSFLEINKTSGSAYPSKAILNRQLAPYTDKEKYLESKIYSKILNADTTIWSAASEDLARLGMLQINGKEIYNLKKGSMESAEAAKTVAYDSILSACNQDMVPASSIVNLIQQGTMLDVIREEIVPAKNLLDKNQDIKCAQTTLSKATVLNTNKNRFELSQEVFMRHYSKEDPEDKNLYSFYKIKVLTSGDLTDLKEGDLKKLDFRAMYTKEYSEETEGKKANYFGTKAGGLSSYSSYIE